MNEVKNRQNLLVRLVESLTDDMDTTIKNVKRLYGAIVLMKANSLSQSAIVNGRDMNEEFTKMQQALRNKGFETVFESVAQIYQLPATFVVRNATVTAIVKIPVIPNGDVEEFHLFQHLRLPVLHDKHLMEIMSSDSNQQQQI